MARHVESCGCAVEADTGRKAVAVDPGIKSRNLNRLRRIEGQVRGIQKMVEDDRWCADVLTQVAAVQEALRSVSRELLKNHLRHCVTKSVKEGPAEAEATIDEIVRLFDRHSG